MQGMMPRLRRDALHLSVRAIALSILTLIVLWGGVKMPLPYLDDEVEGVATTASLIALVLIVPGALASLALGWLSWQAWAELFRFDRMSQRAERIAARRRGTPPGHA